MKAVPLAKNDTSFKLLDDWHSRFECRIRFPYDTQRIETSFGFSDVMVTGDRQPAHEPPILILHGAMAGAAFALGELCDLPTRRRIYAVNIPGQSTRANQVRLDFRTDEYGRWLSEVMDGLSIEQAVVCGVSWGGSVALQLARHFPNRIRGLILVVPGSIVGGPILKNIWHVALPMMRFKMFPSDGNRDRALDSILTSRDPLWSPYLGDALRHWNADFSVPPLLQVGDLKSLTAPVYVIAADKDLSFPGEKLLARSQVLFPNLIGNHLLQDSCHTPSFRQEDRKRFAQLFEKAIVEVTQMSFPEGEPSTHITS